MIISINSFFMEKINLWLIFKPYRYILLHFGYLVILFCIVNSYEICYAEDWYKKTLEEIHSNYDSSNSEKGIFNKKNHIIPRFCLENPFIKNQLWKLHYDNYFTYKSSILPWPTFPYKIYPNIFFDNLINDNLNTHRCLLTIKALPLEEQSNRILDSLIVNLKTNLENSASHELSLKNLIHKTINNDITRNLWLAKNQAELQPNNSALMFYILDNIGIRLKNPDTYVTDKEILRHIASQIYLSSTENVNHKSPGFLINNPECYAKIFGKFL